MHLRPHNTTRFGAGKRGMIVRSDVESIKSKLRVLHATCQTMNLQTELRYFRGQIRQIESLSVKYRESIDNAIMAIAGTEFPLTYFSLFSFLPRLDSLRDGLLVMAGKRELYPCHIVVRAITEHFARLCYLYVRLVEEQTDEVGNEYAVIAKQHEDLLFGYAARARGEHLETPISFDPFVMLQQVSKSARAYSRHEMTSIAKQFGFSRIVAHISSRLATDSGERLPYFPNALLAYADSSAHVHGGAAAVLNVDTELDTRKASLELWRLSEIAYGTAFSSRQLVYQLFVDINPELSALCEALSAVAVQDGERSYSKI